MGLAGVLVKRVFAKSRSSLSPRNGNERGFGLEKSRWSSVRTYLCGDEFNSVLAEDDFASNNSSEASVMQPLAAASGDEESYSVTKTEEYEEESRDEKEADSPIKRLDQENAAILIQSSFRGSLARMQYAQMKKSGEEDDVRNKEDQSGISEDTSIEVQIGSSIDSLRIRVESVAIQHRVLRKSQSQVYRLKEDWDDSTVSSNITKLRIQNRLEAMTRRERALAYAFSQQLRTCATKKKQSQPDSSESNMGWNWLERWMATRLQENSAEDCLSRHLEPIGTEKRTTTIISKKRFDVSVEEKESCGSNDVAVNLDSFTVTSQPSSNGYLPAKNRLKAKRTALRRKSVPNYHYTARPNKASKREVSREAKKDKRCKQLQEKSTAESRAETSDESVQIIV